MEIADRDYALWYRDTTEDMNKYDGKTVSFTALVAIGKEFPADTFVGGRKLMTCCANDVMFAGFVCKTEHRDELRSPARWKSASTRSMAGKAPSFTRRKLRRPQRPKSRSQPSIKVK